MKFIFKVICEGDQVWNLQSYIFCVLDNRNIAGPPSSQTLTRLLIYSQQISEKAATQNPPVTFSFTVGETCSPPQCDPPTIPTPIHLSNLFDFSTYSAVATLALFLFLYTYLQPHGFCSSDPSAWGIIFCNIYSCLVPHL